VEEKRTLLRFLVKRRGNDERSILAFAKCSFHRFLFSYNYLPAIIVAVSPSIAAISPSIAAVLVAATIAAYATIAPRVIAARARSTLRLEAVIAINRTIFTGKERDKGSATTGRTGGLVGFTTRSA
jgi:hypothetical protein